MAFDLSKAAYGKASVSNLDKIKMIPLDQIQGNQQNFYSIEKIDELAETIEMVGLMHPISVVADGEKYRVISGHRRFKAYEKLYLDNLPDQKYARIPAMVMKDLDDLSETLALITANATARELTYSEKCQQERVLRETLQAMKAAGKDVPRNLGQYIADQIGVSRNEVSRMHSVNENLIPEARAKLDAGEMTAQQAYELSRKPEAEQKKSSYVQEALAEVQQEAAERRNLLDRFVEVWAGEYAYSATWAAMDRYESIQLLGKTCRNRGGNSGGVNYNSSAKGVTIGSSANRPHSWTEIWDAVAMYALKDLGRRYMAGNEITSEEDNGASVSAWSTGLPEEDGEYACKFRATKGSIVTRRILYWYNDCWHLFKTEDGCPINETAEVLGWIRLPEDRKED